MSQSLRHEQQILQRVEEEGEEEEECWVVGVSYRGRIRLVQVAAGLGVEELRTVLEAMFSLTSRALALESSDGVCSPLSLVTKAPSYFGQRVEPFRLIISGNDEEDEEQNLLNEEEIDDDIDPQCRRTFAEIMESDEMFREQFGDDEFHVNEFDVRRVCAVFFSLPSSQFCKMTREIYADCVRQLLSEHEILDEERARAVLARVWVAFAECSRGGIVDGAALLVGLTTVCGGDKKLKLSESFALLDTNGNNILELEELERYFYAVFLIAREKDPKAFSQAYPTNIGDPSVLALAAATAEDCFHSADINHDGVISFDEFIKWATPSLPPLEQAAKILGLDRVEAAEVYSCMMQRSGGSLSISRAQFIAMCIDGDFTYDISPSEEQRSERLSVSSRLFELFDRGGGFAHIQDLAAGVGALCGHGRSESNVQFFLGEIIDYQSLYKYFLAVFTVLCDAPKPPNQQQKRSPEKLAQATTERCFKDLGYPQSISYAAFRNWCGFTSASFTNNTPKNLLSIANLRASINIVSLAQIANIFSNATQPLDFDDFARRVRTLKNATIDVSSLDAIAMQLFKVLVRDDEKTIEPLAAILAFSVLCGESNKHITLFELLSLDGQTLNKDDIYLYLRSVFRLVDALEGGGTNRPDEIASVATSKALGGKLRLSKEQFFDWYTKGMNQAFIDTKLSPLSNQTNPGDVIEQKLAQLADADGCIDRYVFVNTLSTLFQNDSTINNDWLNHLFDIIRAKASHYTIQIPANRIRKKLFFFYCTCT
mmetsp:Transcript_1430/g.2080  ORF Transcript_1430/g.2080 Transcript_1430/m.2080 type:complete len:768 (+) Transcript_1430:60-2363(+)